MLHWSSLMRKWHAVGCECGLISCLPCLQTSKLLLLQLTPRRLFEAFFINALSVLINIMTVDLFVLYHSQATLHLTVTMWQSVTIITNYNHHHTMKLFWTPTIYHTLHKCYFQSPEQLAFPKVLALFLFLQMRKTATEKWCNCLR